MHTGVSLERLRRAAALAALLCLPLCAGGCLKLDLTVSIAPDGSGTVDASYSLSEQSVTQVKAMLKLEEQLASASAVTNPLPDQRYTRLFLDPDEKKIRAEIERYARLGVTAQEVKVTARNAWRNVHIKAAFSSLATLQKADFFPEYGFSLAREKDNTYLLSRSAMTTGTVIDAASPETARLLTPVLGGFSAQVRLEVPGRILQTSAPRSSLHAAVWNYDFDRDPAALARLQTDRMRIRFESGGFNLPEVSQSPAR